MADSDGQTDAQKRAAARRAKILARGGTGLQKLAQTARGEEAEMLYGDATPSSRPATPAGGSSAAPSAPENATATPKSGTGSRQQPRPQLSAEQQAMQDQFRAMMSMLGGGGGGDMPGGGASGGDQGGMPDMSQLFAQMMGGGGMPPMGMGTGQNLIGDLDDPAGLGGTPPLGPNGMPNFPDFANLPGLAGMGGMPGMPVPTKGKGWVEKVYPLVHVLSIVVLLAFTLVWWEPTIRSARWAGAMDGADVLGRWGRLSGRSGPLQMVKSRVMGNVEVLPLFWAFTTLELILQTTRFFILNSPPPPHSLISTFLPMLPPGIARPLVTGSRYLTMLSQIYKDGCLLIFGLGLFVIIADYVAVR